MNTLFSSSFFEWSIYFSKIYISLIRPDSYRFDSARMFGRSRWKLSEPRENYLCGETYIETILPVRTVLPVTAEDTRWDFGFCIFLWRKSAIDDRERNFQFFPTCRGSATCCCERCFIYCQTLFWVLSAGVLCTLWVAGWKPTSNHMRWFIPPPPTKKKKNQNKNI